MMNPQIEPPYEVPCYDFKDLNGAFIDVQKVSYKDTTLKYLFLSPLCRCWTGSSPSWLVRNAFFFSGLCLMMILTTTFWYPWFFLCFKTDLISIDILSTTTLSLVCTLNISFFLSCSCHGAASKSFKTAVPTSWRWKWWKHLRHRKVAGAKRSFASRLNSVPDQTVLTLGYLRVDSLSWVTWWKGQHKQLTGRSR